MSSGEMALKNPDGYTVIVVHWGKKQQEAWEECLGSKP